MADNSLMKIGVAAALAVAAVGCAPSAHSTEQDYLNNLSGEQFYQRVGAQAVLAEGYKVCSAHERGAADEAIRQMIRKDLAVSMSAAIDVKVAAEMYLGC